MADTFEIGSTLGGIQSLEEILTPDPGDVFDPDWSFDDFSADAELNDGTVQGQGFPIAKWRWNHVSETNRAVFRNLCPNLSARVYITTKTNEINMYGDPVFETFSAIMKWANTDEDKAADQTLGFILTFTHLELAS